MNFRKLAFFVAALLVTGTLVAVDLAAQQTEAPASAQTSYQPKFPGDPAHSDSEAGALGYMRVVIRAQKDYYKRHNEYATSFTALINHGSFTRRMAQTKDRGDYTVGFRGKKDGYVLIMTPKNLDAQHRSFYAEEDGVIRADETKAADSSSPKLR
jgi:outer membrane lipoprotein-sorting protein